MKEKEFEKVKKNVEELILEVDVADYNKANHLHIELGKFFAHDTSHKSNLSDIDYDILRTTNALKRMKDKMDRIDNYELKEMKEEVLVKELEVICEDIKAYKKGLNIIEAEVERLKE